MKKINRIALAAFMLAAGVLGSAAQDNSTASGVSRRAGNGPRHSKEQTQTSGVTDRMQNHYSDAGASITDADRQWMRVIYRQIDLDKAKNATLYFPEENIEGQENLFRIIMRLLANNQIPAYEYLDGREVFTDKYRIKVRDVLDRFHILYTDAKGSSEKNPRFTIDESDVPTNEVLSYYIIERWEFDTRQNRMRTEVEAICPVLHRSGDFGGEAVKYPMFWLKYSDIRPWLTQQMIFTSDDNNIPTASYDDFFRMNMYEGDIYKTRNLRNQSMAQLYPDPDAMSRAQDSIQKRLTTFEDKLWVADREEVIGGKNKKNNKDQALASADSEENVVSGDNTSIENGDSTENQPKRATKRSTKRSSKKPKESKVKQSKVKTSSSSATRSVRRRR